MPNKKAASTAYKAPSSGWRWVNSCPLILDIAPEKFRVGTWKNLFSVVDVFGVWMLFIETLGE
jgi:hypothetical protein